MIWIGVAGAVIFIGAGAWGCTRSQRRRSAALGVPSWTPLVLITIGLAYGLGAWINSYVPMLIGVLLIFPTNAVTQRRQHGRDLPPRYAALQAVGSPRQVITHPISALKQLASIARHPVQAKRESDEWFEERGL